MSIDIRKTLTDAGYVTVGLGVLGYQQAQVRRREIQSRLGSTGGCLNARAVDGKARLDSLQQTDRHRLVCGRLSLEPRQADE